MSLPIIIISSGAFLLCLALAIYLLPADKLPRRKKEKLPAAPPKDWEEIAKRWEKQNQDLRKELDNTLREKKNIQEDIQEEKKQYAALQEKMNLEKTWREKEHTLAERVKERDEQFKKQLVDAENSLGQEHAARLKLERELQELKIQLSALNEDKRQLTLKVMNLETNETRLGKDVRDLKRVNAELSRQREDVQWVAKSEFDALKKTLAEKENELDRIKRSITPPAPSDPSAAPPPPAPEVKPDVGKE